MAKRKNRTAGVICGCIGGLLALGIVAGVGYKSQGFRDWDVKGWFEKTDTTFTLSYDGFEFNHSASELKKAHEDKKDLYLAIGGVSLDLDEKLNDEKVLESFVAINKETEKQYTITFEKVDEETEKMNIVVADYVAPKKEETKTSEKVEEQVEETNSSSQE